MKDDSVYLRHIVECAGWIETFVQAGHDTFLADRRTQSAVLRELQTLAESTQRVSSALKDAHPEVPWAAIAGFRNVLVHDYLGISLERVWSILITDLPGLRGVVEQILQDQSRAGGPPNSR